MSDPQSDAPSVSHHVLSTSWSAPENLSGSTGQSTHPVVVSGEGGIIHVVWEEDESIMHSVRENGRWLAPDRISAGQHPAAALGPDNRLHLVFSNEFFDNFDIFYVIWDSGTWTLPIRVSKTSGLSVQPDVAVDGSGVAHATWADQTPGFNIIYHGWYKATWLNEPLHNARGSSPAIRYDPQRGVLHLAWQAPGIGSRPLEILHLEGDTYNWTLPENISASSDQDSINVSMACDSAGVTHLVWQEMTPSNVQIRHAGGHAGNWTAPRVISEDGRDGYDPVALVTQENQLSVAWRRGNVISYRRRSGNTAEWQPVDHLIANDVALDDIALGGDSAGKLHMVWSGWTSGSQRDVYYSNREPILRPQVFMPAVGTGR